MSDPQLPELCFSVFDFDEDQIMFYYEIMQKAFS